MQNVKSFAIPDIFSAKASLNHVSNNLVQVANKECFNFIWKGKDGIGRLALMNEIEYGEVRCLTWTPLILAQRTMRLYSSNVFIQKLFAF